MKRFLVHLSIFLAAITLCCSIYSTCLYRTFTEKPSTAMPPHDVLILGSSRAHFHINPQILDTIVHCDSYNLGFDNCQVDYHTARLQHYLNTHTDKPSLILWCVDFLAVGQSVGYAAPHSFPFMYYDKDFASLLKSYPEFKDPLYRLTSNFLAQRIFHPYLFKLHREFFSELMTEESSGNKGFLGRTDPWDGTAYAEFDSIRWRKDPQSMRIFVLELERLRQDNIQVVFVFTPLYHDAARKIVRPEKLYAMYDSIARSYSVPILDYTDCYLSFDSTYFSNAEHLNSLGANLFTQMLANDLDSIIRH